jgi:hypothetical protein
VKAGPFPILTAQENTGKTFIFNTLHTPIGSNGMSMWWLCLEAIDLGFHIWIYAILWKYPVDGAFRHNWDR